MARAIIEVQDLSKKFIISHEAESRQRYTSLRDVIAKKVRAIGQTKETTFVQKEEFWALKDITFSVQQGDRVGIIGRNGAGKSTLLKILSQITEPSSGTIKIKGRVASLLEVGTGFHPELTGRENIFLNGAILGMNRGEIRDKFDEIVAFAEVEKFLDTPVKRYSSGMYVRLAFAVAAHLEPEVLIVDEVLAVGDAHFQKKCLGKMEDVSNNQGRTVLFVSHNMGVIKHLCNKGIFLDKGSISVSGDIQSVVSGYSDSFSKNNIDNYKHIAGDQRVKIDKVRINGDQGIDIFHRIIIDLEFSFSQDVDHNERNEIHFFVLFYNNEGEVVWSVFQKDSGKFDMNFRNNIRLQVENILVPGRYIISAGIFDGNDQFVDWVERVEAFEVLPVFEGGRAFDGRYGMVTSRAVWS